MITVDHQPLAQRILRAAAIAEHPPQQLFLFGPAGTGKRAAALDAAWALMDPDDTHGRTDTALDLILVEATGQQILLADLDEALARLAAVPNVMRRRVMVLIGAERLDNTGGARLLKILEEPPSRSTVILVTDHPDDVLDTVRSRCLPVPFRTLGWSAARERESAFESAMHHCGIDLALAAMAGEPDPAGRVRQVQARMEGAAGTELSDEVKRLKAEAEALAGKRGERTAAKRAEDQEKRERRRLVTDGWSLVLEAAGQTVNDALALAVGAEGAVRHAERLEELRAIASEAGAQEFLERAAAEIQLSRSELVLNPRVELMAEGLLVRIDNARHHRGGRLVSHGRLPA